MFIMFKWLEVGSILENLLQIGRVSNVWYFDALFTASGTQTVAVKQSDGSYKLYGYKWFSSATDADVALTLACDCDEHGHSTEVCHDAVCKGFDTQRWSTCFWSVTLIHLQYLAVCKFIFNSWLFLSFSVTKNILFTIIWWLTYCK